MEQVVASDIHQLIKLLGALPQLEKLTMVLVPHCDRDCSSNLTEGVAWDHLNHSRLYSLSLDLRGQSHHNIKKYVIDQLPRPVIFQFALCVGDCCRCPRNLSVWFKNNNDEDQSIDRLSSECVCIHSVGLSNDMIRDDVSLWR